LSLPWLVFYGVGVTVGAGIFALVGQVVGLAGDHAPLAFVISGLVAGFTGFSYAALAGAYPRAAGEALFVKMATGETLGRIVGIGIIAVAITSCGVISLAFAGYVGSIAAIPEQASLIAILLALAAIAWAGVKESVVFAGLITFLEVGTLLAVVAAGLPLVLDGGTLARVWTVPTEAPVWTGVISGAFVAFFAFIGFEDIENMAEETTDPHRNIPRAILLTLVVSVAIYALVATVAAAFPDRDAIAGSKAPLALLFERATGIPGTAIAIMASVAMINGILVQIVMASRVLYGMAREGLLPAAIGVLDANRQTPLRAIILVAAAAGLLALTVPLLQLAEFTSLVMLLVFALVNASLFILGSREAAMPVLRRWRWCGAAGAMVSLGLVAAELLA
jgi:amino acid transporter